MQMHGYLEELIGSRVSIRIVKALIDFPGKIYTVRKLAQTADVSVSEAATIVRQLERSGVLSIQPVGRSYLLTLNNHSYILNKILKPMIQAERDTLSTFVSLLRSVLDSDAVESAVLFGSVVANKEHPDSDIDLLIISDNRGSAALLVAKAQEQISAVFGGRLSPLIMSKKELLRKKGDQLVLSILDNYMIIVGKDLRELF